ncbi:uncharacterized protein LOC133286045 [Gastrolobium bilobum]|uniref:uncharacterized protein LOC133286045 n=1 Tax=Gastrolobium bilobum TaxID=150636 RepID=UPI002AAF4272|nr:uncharacterized protein LOC133286045 [Gastrolobium bilobum]
MEMASVLLLGKAREMATMSSAFAASPSLCSFPSTLTLSHSHRHRRVFYIKPLYCAPIHQQFDDADVDATIMCEPCNGKGWLLCDFCKGQKTNVKAENKRLYRRCPTCRAVGYVLCSRCKVFKCVTFPNFNDSES